MEKFAKLRTSLRRWKVPQDGKCRFLYDAWQPLALLVLTACFTAVFFALQNPYATGTDVFFCNADGRVDKQEVGVYKPLWDPNLYFTVNIAYGKLTFTQAKVIDACWDVLVGRGGQALVALVAYRVLRRSINLSMEKGGLSVPAATSICCRQIQFLSVCQLLRGNFGLENGDRQPRKSGRIPRGLRLATQVSVCVYVLVFATLGSVMTGYRTELTGVFDYDPAEASRLKPINEIFRPRMSVFDGNRIELEDSRAHFRDQVALPEGSKYNITEMLAASQSLDEPYGTLIDYHFTCAGLQWRAAIEISLNGSKPLPIEAQNLTCAYHECWCALPEARAVYNSSQILGRMTSKIAISGKRWDLPAPPLNVTWYRRILFNTTALTKIVNSSTEIRNASAYWKAVDGRTYLIGDDYYSTINDTYGVYAEQYVSNGAYFNESTIKQTSRCIADDKYSWGFSSLLLLTFCICTMLFAIGLILLQTDVYWNSILDRNYQGHDIYRDVLFLANELKRMTGSETTGLKRAAESCKSGITVQADDPRPSRSQQWDNELAVQYRQYLLTHEQRARQKRAKMAERTLAREERPANAPSIELAEFVTQHRRPSFFQSTHESGDEEEQILPLIREQHPPAPGQASRPASDFGGAQQLPTRNTLSARSPILVRPFTPDGYGGHASGYSGHAGQNH